MVVRGAATNKAHTKTWIRIAQIEIPILGTYVPYSHSNCRCNQIVALNNRVLGEAIKPDPTAMIELQGFVTRIAKRMPKVGSESYTDFANRYVGKRKNAYMKIATNDLLVNGVSRKDSRVTMFVKAERMDPNKVNPDPRAIQFRTPIYCVALGSRLKPIEHLIYEMKGDGKLLPPTRCIGKGLNSQKRAELLVRKCARFDKPVIISLDASRFDKHVSAEVLKVEHSFYTTMNSDPELARLLSWQLANRGRTSEGITYKTNGRRMSGDMNTALGNCVIMVSMVGCFMQGKKWDCLDDGDDVLVVVEAELEEWVTRNVHSAFRRWGFDMKIESVAYTIPTVSWCQSNPLRVQPGVWKFIRHPRKVISNSLSGFKYMEGGARAKLLNAVGQCELSLNHGVPILQEFALCLIRNSGTTKTLDWDVADAYYHRMKGEQRVYGASPPTSECRLDFMEAFGITIEWQLALEEFFKTWKFSIEGCERLVADMNDAWERPHGPYTREVYTL